MRYIQTVRTSLNNVLMTLLSFVMGLAIFFLILRFIFRLFGANANNEAVEWIYETSYVLVAPFIGIFPNSRLQTGAVLEFNTLFAIIIYMIIFALVLALVDSLTTKKVVVNEHDQIIEEDV